MTNIIRLGILGIALFIFSCKKTSSERDAKNAMEDTDSIKNSKVIVDSMAGRSFGLDAGDAVRNYGGSTGAGTKARPNHDKVLGLKN